MKNVFALAVAGVCLIFAAETRPAADILPVVPAGVEALSLSGESLISPAADAATIEKFEAAKEDYDRDSMAAENIIWFGRRTAYLGNYRSAIEIFTEGIEKHPRDARMYRHRGHRYISIREFDRAIADFEAATGLIERQENRIEPDGLPNSQNIPLTTTHGNIWYHLGLAYYLKQDWENALRAFRNGYNLGGNDDNLVSTGHWIYMIYRRMGMPAEAAAALEDISPDMNIVENRSYHELCLLYKGEILIDEMMSANGDDPANAAVAYGLANWFYYNGDVAASAAMLANILAGSSWSSFGFIAAEADRVSR
jgi:tetratricopeptide (TPR) repeat protein|tara:strand:- start:3432 stop:4361 length:930 start_codon:yes stop_codon:yes gene_type:complete